MPLPRSSMKQTAPMNTPNTFRTSEEYLGSGHPREPRSQPYKNPGKKKKMMSLHKTWKCSTHLCHHVLSNIQRYIIPLHKRHVCSKTSSQHIFRSGFATAHTLLLLNDHHMPFPGPLRGYTTSQTSALKRPRKRPSSVGCLDV